MKWTTHVQSTHSLVHAQVWFAFFGIIYIAFYFFTSPFVGNPELLDSWTPYVYISMILYGWLGAAAALHIPVNSLGQFGATIKQPVRSSPCIPFLLLRICPLLTRHTCADLAALSVLLGHVRLARGL